MFFKNFIERKLASLLQPWLRDPELELKLGFFRLNGTLSDVNLNTSALNELLDDPSRICFKEASVEHISFRVSPLSSDAFTLFVRGFHIVLALGEEEDERGVKRKRKPRDTTADERTKVLEEIDPEGCALHGAIKRISDITTRTWRTSLISTVISHCNLQLHDVHVLLQSSCLPDPFSCSLYMEKVGAASCIIGHRQFMRGLMSSIFVPFEETSIDVDVSSFEIRLNTDQRVSYVLPSTNVFALVKLSNLRYSNVCFHVPALEFLFSPADLSVIVLLHRLLSTEPKHTRSGRQLWKIVAAKISSLCPTSNSSLVKLVTMACLWLRYLSTYQSMLRLIGYPADEMMKKSASMIFHDEPYSRSIVSKWKLISEVENNLPPEAIALARRITRYRAASNPVEFVDLDRLLAIRTFSKIFQLLMFILSMVNTLFLVLMKILFLHKILPIFSKSTPQLISFHESSIIEQSITINVQQISVAISSDTESQPSLHWKAASDANILFQSFTFSVESIFVRCMVNIAEQSFMFASGCLEVCSFPTAKAGTGSYTEKHSKKRVDMRRNVLCSEPAQYISFPVHSDSEDSENITGSSAPQLDYLLAKLWLNWEDYRLKPEGENVPNVDLPWILCEIWSNVTVLGRNDSGSGFSCCLVVGKLNFNLENDDVASAIVLFKQIQYALYWRARVENVSSQNLEITVENISMRHWSSKISSYYSKVETNLIRMLPEKQVQVAVLISGPCIMLSLSNNQFQSESTSSQNLSQFSFELCDIELLISPKLEEHVGISKENTESHVGEPVCLGLKEIDTPNSDNEIYSCHGQFSLNAYLKVSDLKAYMDESIEDQKHQILALRPTIAQLSCMRKCYHSFASSVVSVSAALHWVVTDLSCLIFLDEVYALTKIIVGIFYESLAFPVDGSGGHASHETLPRRGAVHLDSEDGDNFIAQSKHVSLVTDTQVYFSGTCQLKSFDLVIHSSRKHFSPVDHTRMVSVGKLSMHDAYRDGIYFTIPKLIVDFKFSGQDLDGVVNVTGVRFIIFRYLDDLGGNSEKSELKTIICSLHFLNEASVRHSSLSFCLRTIEKAVYSVKSHGTSEESVSHGKASHTSGIFPWIENTEQPQNECLSAKVCISEVYIAGSQAKDILVNDFVEFNACISVGSNFRVISCECKGGSVLLEVAAVMMLFECIAFYHQWVSELRYSGQSSSRVLVAQSISEMSPPLGRPTASPQQVQHGEVMRDCLEALCINVMHLSLVLMGRDESGKLQELIFEVDLRFGFELNSMRKLSINIPRFSVLSQYMQGDLDNKSEVIRGPFSSAVPVNSSIFTSMDMDTVLSLPNRDSIPTDLINADGLSSYVSQNVSRVGTSTSNLGQKILYTSPQTYILKDFQGFLAIEGPVTRSQTSPADPKHIWVGSGSILGLEMTISICTIKMVLSAFETLSNVLTKEGISTVESRHWSYSQESGGSVEDFIPDGTIVAIQDVDQHMYIAVGDAASRYDITGAVHYSLVGEKALFRVRYHKPRIWKTGVQYFSLISLYAKDEYGESLRLSCHQRSRFVEMSCSNDRDSALWRMIPFKPDVYEDAVELKSSTILSERTFHLVNKKNDYAVAFIDNILEFVGKPGNIFKCKVFRDSVPLDENLFPNSHVREVLSSSLTGPSEICTSSGVENIVLESETSNMGERTNGSLFGVTITVDKMTLTIVHEISDTEEKFPLLQGTIMPNQIVIQILDSKVRVMNAIEVNLYHFDAQQNTWKELIQPLEICTFYSQKFLPQGDENFSQRVTRHFHARIKEVTLLLSEHSLDVLLFVIGELDLAGPYAVKSSYVLANCCKIVNESGLTLICQFYGNQDASLSARQSTSIFLRHLALANQPPEASFFSVQLAQQNFLSTSLIRLSLSEARQFACRTRIVSPQDSKSFPGPLIVVEISKGVEDGLSIDISPLLKIHNETDFSLELRFQRPQHEETESASLILKAGEVTDDSETAFTAISLSGGLRKALTSLSVGNYTFSFRPNISDKLKNLKTSSVEWSDNLKGGKPVRLSGLFDKLSYQVRKALSVNSVKVSLSTASCAVKTEEGLSGDMHFLIQTTGKAVPVVKPDKFGYISANINSPAAMQEQKEIFLLPTVQLSNSLHTEIHVSLTDRDPNAQPLDCSNLWCQATISCGSTANFYANPATIFFVVTLTSSASSSKPVSSGDWVKKLKKQKVDVSHLDIELDFGGGKYFAMLRLSRGPRGTLEARVFTPYALHNNTNVPLYCLSANQKLLSRGDLARFGTDIPLELGSYLPPNSLTSWFLKCHQLCFKLLEEKELDARLDLDALSGLTEIDLKSEELYGAKSIMRLGVSLRSALARKVSSHTVSLSSRYVVCNESEDVIAIRQCYMEDMEELLTINGKQRVDLRLKTVITRQKETNIFESLLRRHTKSQYDSSFFIQFRPNGNRFGWSGPVCVASLGRFFLRFRKSLEFPEIQSDLGEFAAVHAEEKESTIFLHFQRPPINNLPYRIENCLYDAPITYYQKGTSSEPETLGAGVSIFYVWDDLTLPHKLVVKLDDLHLLREINLDKVRSWKPFYSKKQTRGLGPLGFHVPQGKKPEEQKRTTYGRLLSSETVKVGFEVYAEGVTRVLRICKYSDSRKGNIVSGSCTKLRLRISYFSVHMLELFKQDVTLDEPFDYAPIIITRLERINWDALFTNQHKYNQISVQSLSVDEKWVGAPFAAMLRRHQSEKFEANNYILHVAVILLPTNSSVKQIKYLSIVLQPLDLNLDEETLMKIVPFWRSSLGDSSAPRQQYYFDHFEIHPIKIVASFLPGDLNYRYSSTQETLRSLLHSVIKIPAIKRKPVELNGVLVTHALITLRELSIKCAQHYSWYAMRAIYIAKGSPLLPPGFASIFDDLASSSLDVFFDPSTGVVNIPGVTLGTLKLISKFIDNKGFSGTKRYFGDMGKTLKTAGSNMLFAAVTEISDSVLRGAETSGFKGMVNGFHQGILRLAMEPSVLSNAFMEGGPDRKIKLDRSPGVDELYIEGYLQSMLDTMYKQEYLRVRVVENQVILKNLPPSSSLIDEIMEHVKGFLASKALLKRDSTTDHSLLFIRGEREWQLGPTLLTLGEHLFVSFVIRTLRKQSDKVLNRIKWKEGTKAGEDKTAEGSNDEPKAVKFVWKWGIGRFVLSGIVAYIDGRLCRNIPHPLARRIVSGFLLSFLDQSDDGTK